MKNSQTSVLKGLTAGLVGGFVASLVMNQFQALVGKLVFGIEDSHGAQSLQKGAPRRGIGSYLQTQQGDDSDDDAAERLANAISQRFLHRELSKTGKGTAGTALHYAYGAGTGAFYGAAVEFVPACAAGAGSAYGAVVWLGADEGVVPALGLSKAPSEFPLAIHLYALSSHVVYGVTTEVVRGIVRRAISTREESRLKLIQ